MLTIELVPKTCFFNNLRQMLSRSEWDKLRHHVYALAGHKCQGCNGAPKRLECHEIWEYDDEKHIQKLVGMTALCIHCHRVKHIGLARMQGHYDEAVNHMAQINDYYPKDAKNDIEEAFKLWAKRSRYNWRQDISWLHEFTAQMKQTSCPVMSKVIQKGKNGVQEQTQTPQGGV